MVHTSISAIHFLASVSSPATVGNTYKSHRRRKSTIEYACLTGLLPNWHTSKSWCVVCCTWTMCTIRSKWTTYSSSCAPSTIDKNILLWLLWNSNYSLLVATLLYRPLALPSHLVDTSLTSVDSDCVYQLVFAYVAHPINAHVHMASYTVQWWSTGRQKHSWFPTKVTYMQFQHKSLYTTSEGCKVRLLVSPTRSVTKKHAVVCVQCTELGAHRNAHSPPYLLHKGIHLICCSSQNGLLVGRGNDHC